MNEDTPSPGVRHQPHCSDLGSTSPCSQSLEQLEMLLAEGADGARKRERSAFDELAAPYASTVVLFGAGGLGRRTLAGLREHGVEPAAFVDSNPAAWGQQIDGVPVLDPEAGARRYGNSAVFVVTIWGALGKDRMKDRIDQLKKLGCERVASFGLLYWKYPEGLLPHYGADLPHKVHEQAAAREAFELWDDEASRREYISQIRWRLLLDFDGLAGPVEHNIYFPRDLCTLSPDEVFVDCGAFDGDTVQLFLKESGNTFRKIVAFEPDPANFLRLQENSRHMPGADGQAISVRQAATGARCERVRLKAEGNESSSVGEGDVEVDSVALDEALGDPPPTYLKMDVEGAELDTLMGATRIVREHAPVLAVCCYHRQDHLWNIPLLIRSLNSDYRFFLRPHDLEMWDLVCYAIPRQRLRARS
jgi:FkbM family methyltransferase